jgi:anaerobic selenocysteine-containing dehydrogenase
MRVRAAIIDIARGAAAMYFPEANALVPGALDPQSQTPAFKSVPVTVRTV